MFESSFLFSSACLPNGKNKKKSSGFGSNVLRWLYTFVQWVGPYIVQMYPISFSKNKKVLGLQ